MFAPYYQAYTDLRSHTEELDLEKYLDVYELSVTDIEDAQIIADADLAELESMDSLHDLKIGLQKLHIVRKLFLCSLLALDADGGKADFAKWSMADDTLRRLTGSTSSIVNSLEQILREEEGERKFRCILFDCY